MAKKARSRPHLRNSRPMRWKKGLEFDVNWSEYGVNGIIILVLRALLENSVERHRNANPRNQMTSVCIPRQMRVKYTHGLMLVFRLGFIQVQLRLLNFGWISSPGCFVERLPKLTLGDWLINPGERRDPCQHQEWSTLKKDWDTTPRNR